MKPAMPATISCAWAARSAPSSPKYRHKFLCSHGGRILPRPSDGQLKYVGGETRVISLPPDISFQEAMKRLTYLIDGEMILKYQLVSEDLDALVSVKSDEDLIHMFDEMQHYEITGSPRMRAFLFPANHVLMMENQTEPLPVEQRYIYSINGINTKQLASLNSSACTSPRSPDSFFAEAINTESVPLNNYQNSMMRYKIQSSPSKCNNLNHIPHQNSTHFVHPQDYHRNAAAAAAPERLISVRSVGRSGVITSPPDQYFYAPREVIRGSGCCTMHHDDHSSRFSDTRIIERQATLPSSLGFLDSLPTVATFRSTRHGLQT